MGQSSSETDRSGALVVQLSDTHLCGNAAALLHGINTSDCFNAVLELADADLRQADAIVVTGDISHDGSPASYHFLGERLDACKGLKYYLPGNHDQPKALRQSLPQPLWPTVDKLGSWSLVGISTHVPNFEGGILDDAQLDILVSSLAQQGERPVLIAMHHPPIPTGSPWLDEIGLLNAAEFLTLLRRHDNVRAVVFGHAHQEIDASHHGMRFLGAPATCEQFTPDSDQQLPGYRWLRLLPDGELETGIERVEGWPAGSAPTRRREG